VTWAETLAWADALAAQGIPFLRWIALVLAVPVALWSAPGFMTFARRPGVVSGFRALAFLVAASTLSFNSGYMIEGIPRPIPHPRTLLSLALLIASLFTALGGLWIFRGIRRKGVQDLFEAIEATGPIAELWKHDPAAARGLARQARAMTVDRILKEN
jgi:hypothetical protein